ncbi:hypothetical protein [Rhodococcus koreensis]
MSRPTQSLHVATWNLNNAVEERSHRQAALARSLDLDLLLVQEANPRSLRTFTQQAGFDWAVSTDDLAIMLPRQGRRWPLPVAVLGRGPRPRAAKLIIDAPLPERIIVVEIDTHIGPLTAVAYHAPPGVNWKLKKVEQALLLSRWLATVDGSIVIGADMNTPDIDHPDRDAVRTHWHTGMAKLNGGPGDDLVFGGTPTHTLDDAFRRWLDDHPDELGRIRAQRPDGPLAVSHRTGRTSTSPGTPRRYDTIWISKHLRVLTMNYDYDDALRAGSDHALVHSTLTTTH